MGAQQSGGRRPSWHCPGPPGLNAAHVFSNTLLDAANSTGDVDAFVSRLIAIVNGLDDAEFQPARFENGGLRSG
ncbi:hypothetical protein [Bosea sp. BK604]|uniref:hypothetical protein n=1 Tax=Bosea sp. BK604 TaxID=2512180 RepID=UPI001404E0FA|nr:hypothetical protein [Bosea sp. BK604]